LRKLACASLDVEANESRSRNLSVPTSKPSKYLLSRNCLAVKRRFGYRVRRLASTSWTSCGSLRHCDETRPRPSSRLVRSFLSEWRFWKGGPVCVWIACRMQPSEYMSFEGAGGDSSRAYSGAVCGERRVNECRRGGSEGGGERRTDVVVVALAARRQVRVEGEELPPRRRALRVEQVPRLAEPAQLPVALGVDEDGVGREVAVHELGRLVEELEALAELRQALLHLDLVELEVLRRLGPVRRAPRGVLGGVRGVDGVPQRGGDGLGREGDGRPAREDLVVSFSKACKVP